jgi:mycothiol system anti-sigma-R factor
MPSCREIDPLVTPYVDGEVSAAERAAVEGHLAACPPCRERAEAERAARATLKLRCCQPGAPEHLRARCRKVATPIGRLTCTYSPSQLSMFAALVLVAGGVSVYGLTRLSPTVLAAQLTIDHVKCFALHDETTGVDAPAAEAQFAQSYGWPLHVLQAPAADGLQLLGVRRCFCGEGPAVHVMYRHHGAPVSIYVLRNVNHPSALTGAFGYDAVIWTKQSTTYVLIGDESSASLEHLAADLN